MRDWTVEPVSRDQIFRRERGQGNINFPCSADHEQDWQPYPVDPHFAINDDHTYIYRYIHTYILSSSLAIRASSAVYVVWICSFPTTACRLVLSALAKGCCRQSI